MKGVLCTKTQVSRVILRSLQLYVALIYLPRDSQAGILGWICHALLQQISGNIYQNYSYLPFDLEIPFYVN